MISWTVLSFFASSFATFSKASYILSKAHSVAFTSVPKMLLYSSQPPPFNARNSCFKSFWEHNQYHCHHFTCSKNSLAGDSCCHWPCIPACHSFSASSRKCIPRLSLPVSKCFFFPLSTFQGEEALLHHSVRAVSVIAAFNLLQVLPGWRFQLPLTLYSCFPFFLRPPLETVFTLALCWQKCSHMSRTFCSVPIMLHSLPRRAFFTVIVTLRA